MPLPQGTLVRSILQALSDLGPLTCIELCTELNKSHDELGSVVSRLRKATAKRPKRIYITAYTYDAEGQRRYPRAIYALGDAKDAPRPKSDVKANRQRCVRNTRLRATANSVFNLALTREQLRAKNHGTL